MNEGKIKIIYVLFDLLDGNYVLLKLKDKIIVFDSIRKNDFVGKVKFSNAIIFVVFELFNICGIKTYFVRKYDDEFFIGVNCDMIFFEVVIRRIVIGLFLKRYIGIKEGYRFVFVKLEMFFKDDV